MSLFGQFSSAMRNQDGGVTIDPYSFDRALIKRIRIALLNSDGDDIEAEFLLDSIPLTIEDRPIELSTHIAHHLYDYLQGHKL